jgi:accessory gene regulator protein AgrB
MSDPQAQPVPTTPPNPNPAGSLGLGIALAWACLIGGYIAVAMVASLMFSVIRGGSDGAAMLALLMCVLPWVGMVVLIVYFAKNNKPRTALGVGVGIGSIIGVLLLLIAACFGLLSGTNFH